MAAESADESRIDTAIADPGGRTAHRYGVVERGEVFAVRPDGFIGMRALIDDNGPFRAYFATLYRVSA